MMKPGDLIRARSGTTEIEMRGLVLEVRSDPELTRWNGSPEVYVKILFSDGRVYDGDIRHLPGNYEVIE